MADNIRYDFGANAGSLSDINGMLGQIQDVRQDISSIFTTLMSVYEGDGAAALSAAHVKIDGMLDEAINTTVNTQKQAQYQQDAMQALDRANAASL